MTARRQSHRQLAVRPDLDPSSGQAAYARLDCQPSQAGNMPMVVSSKTGNLIRSARTDQAHYGYRVPTAISSSRNQWIALSDPLVMSQPPPSPNYDFLGTPPPPTYNHPEIPPYDSSSYYTPISIEPVHTPISYPISTPSLFPLLNQPYQTTPNNTLHIEYAFIPSPRGARSARFPCEVPNCNTIVGRKYDLKRHMDSVHGQPTIDCPVAECVRVGASGFHRWDHYYVHLKRAHGVEERMEEEGG